jgi:hypothetical protein
VYLSLLKLSNELYVDEVRVVKADKICNPKIRGWIQLYQQMEQVSGAHLFASAEISPLLLCCIEAYYSQELPRFKQSSGVTIDNDVYLT